MTKFVTLIQTDIDELTVKESYALIKRRLLDAAEFIEVTGYEDGLKLIINKFVVHRVLLGRIEVARKKK